MCDTVAVVERTRVLFAKNSDRDPNEAQALEWHPGAEHPEGATVRCTWISVPQVPRTLSVLISRPFWGWGAEMGANEGGVVIGNEAVFTREPLRKLGLTGMDILRLALERATSAAAAVEVICELLETVGQGGGAGHEKRSFSYHNSYLVADPERAYVVETAGRRWAAERVFGARSISNGLTIPAFAERYGDRLRTRVACAAERRARTADHAGAAAGPAEMIRLLRDHGAGREAPRYRWLTGGMDAPCMHAGGVLATSQTTSSWVSELDPKGPRHWATGTAAPCTGIFKPVAVQTPLDLGPTPSDRFDERTVWWRHERLHRQVMRDPGRLLPPIAAERDRIEREWLAAGPEPATAWAEARRLTDRWTAEALQATVVDRRPGWVRRYWARRDRRAGLRGA